MTTAHATRVEVLGLAAELFASRGFRATSLELVADRLGVTRPALYYHFKTKSQILAALLDDVMTKLETAVDAVPKPASGDDEPRFITMLSAHIDVTLENADQVTVLVRERAEAARIKTLQSERREKAYSRRFVRAYAEGVADGQLVDIEPWIVFNTLISGANGGTNWLFGGRPSRDVGRFKQDLLTLLVGGLRGSGARVTARPSAGA
jgi:AcrR family transcriptional regulator